MKKSFFQKETVRNVQEAGEWCEVCKRGKEIDFEFFSESENKWKLSRACDNPRYDYTHFFDD